MTVGAVNPFKPLGTVTLAASTVPASASLPALGDALQVFNGTASVAFIDIGKGAAAATTGSFPVPPGGSALIAAGPYVDTVSAVLGSGAGAVFVTIGEGTQA